MARELSPESIGHQAEQFWSYRGKFCDPAGALFDRWAASKDFTADDRDAIWREYLHQELAAAEARA